MATAPSPGVPHRPAGEASRQRRRDAAHLLRTVEAPPLAARPEGARSPVTRLLLTFLAMTGWRLEHLTPLWAAGGVASLALARVLMVRNDWRLTIPYFALTLAFYYGGNSLILASRAPERAVRRLGERRAWRAYESLLGLMFLNQGLGVGAMTALSLPGLGFLHPLPWLRGIGGLLLLAGISVKLWATWLVGVDTFYFKDLFLRRAGEELVKRGPYRMLSNPMYGVGQLQGYGYALVALSPLGLLASGIGQLLTYAVFFAVERPFLRTAYASPGRA
jgi:protein-S-isoprenylcysteine O-methyltransferase Ste14